MPAFRGGKNADLFHSAPAAIESPTEEDETEKNKEPVDEGTLRKVYITPLKTETKAVVKEVDPSVVVSDLDEVFALGYIPLDRFQKKLQSLLKKAQESNVHFKTIDFGKDGYITDAVIKSLFDTLGKNALSKVTKVSLEGCSIITDVGLHWLAKGLSENKHSIQVNINGCSKVTDGGLVTLINAANIGHIEAMATAVSHIREGGNTKGCPLLMDPKKFYSQTQKESYLVVVPMATKLSLSNYLISKSKKERQPVEHTQNLHLSDWNVNVMEMERNHILFEYVLPPNPVHVIIPFDASADIKDLKGQVIETIAHVLSKEQLNPKQNIKNRKLLVGSSGFFEITYWSKCNLSLDGTLSNTSDNQNVIGFVASQRTLSRTNNYFEVQCLTSQLESGLVIGITYDVVASERFPLEVNETNGGCVEGFETEEGVTYGFGIKGTWLSEYVPGDDCVFYITKGGIETKTMPEKPQTGMYPFVSVIGKNVGCTVKLLNMACPPEGLQGQWYDKKQYWTPGFRHNILCDDRGIASYVDTYSSSDERGVLLFQEQITREHNTFTIKVIERGANGVISMGFGTEDYPTNRHPGWEKNSVGYHADDGLLYIQSGSGTNPSTGVIREWQNGDEITVVVNIPGESNSIQSGEEVEAIFSLNGQLISNVKTRMTNVKKGLRFVFMVGMRVKGTKLQIMNFRQPYVLPPPRMDMLTMGRANFMKIMDDGKLSYRKFDERNWFGLYMSKTPFSKHLTHFEIEVLNLGSQQHAAIGFAERFYLVNNMVGWHQGSVGYHADNGQLYNNSSSGKPSKLTSDPPTFGNGDVVGCWLDETTAKFREDGTLKNQQTLKFYFKKNGVKVHEFEFEYLSDGIYPAVNLHYEGDKVMLRNYYHGSETGDLEVKDTKETQKVQDDFVEGCKFTIVGIETDGAQVKGKLQLLQEALGGALEFPALSLIEQNMQMMESSPKLMDLQGQQLYGQLAWQKECLERFMGNKSRLKFMAVDLSSDKDHQALCDHIVEVCETDLSYHRKYYDLHDTIATGLKKISDTLATEKLMAADQLYNLVSDKLGPNGRVYEAAVRYLQTKGRLFWVPMKRTTVAIDIQFAKNLVNSSMILPDKLSGSTATCIGEETHIWHSISEIVPEVETFSQAKKDILSHVLVFMGVIEVPRFRDNGNGSKTNLANSPMFCYCTTKSIGSLPVQLFDFIQSTKNNIVLIEREYQFLHSSPANMLSMIVARCLAFSKPLVIGQDWSVFQSGAAQTVIFVQGEQKLRVETRCFMPPSSRESDRINYDTLFHVQEYAFNIYSLFTDTIDLLIMRLRIKALHNEKIPYNMVNNSIGCIHHWDLSDDDYRQTLCTLCGKCCEKGRYCEYNGVGGEYQHQCGCDTNVTGCADCGICQNCAELLWTIRSYLRPNLEVASYGKMRSSPYIPIQATTYDEVDITNLGANQTPICLKVSTGHGSSSDHVGVLTKMFPFEAVEFPDQKSLEADMNKWSQNSDDSKLMTFDQGDTVTIKLEPIKRDPKKFVLEEEESQDEIVPHYFTCICRESTVWHDTGIVAYTSSSPAVPVGQFISASALTPECNSFSFEIVNPGKHCYIAIGLCHKRYAPDRQPGWDSGSLGYHADDGGIFAGAGWASAHASTCTKGDIMKCELNFEEQTVTFYKNGQVVYTTSKLRKFGNFHAAVGFHSVGEAVRLLEKEPWQMTGDEEPDLPSAFDSYKYGNMYISPGKKLPMMKVGGKLQGWLFIYNPSKNIVGFKISPPHIVTGDVSFLEPSKCRAFRLSVDPTEDKELYFVHIHWFLLESNREYNDEDILPLYNSTTSESLLKHRLAVSVTDVQSSELLPLKLATEEPDSSHGYLAEVFKNGISVQKYWLKRGNYVCHLLPTSNVLVRYPKYPTLGQPNGFQKGMRIVIDLPEKDLYAEAIIEEATEDGFLRLEYSRETTNEHMKAKITDPVISIKEIEYEIIEKQKNEVEPQDGKKSEDQKPEVVKVAALNLISYEPRGHVSVTKRAYVFPPFHLLTEASQAAIESIDNVWRANTLNSVAQCRSVPTRVTVQELQLSELIGSDTEWLVGANSSRKFDMAFAFLPSNLGHKTLCYPSVPRMFTNIDVHVLCFLVDQMYFNIQLGNDHEISLDVPLHFVNVNPITPSPPLQAEDMYTSAFNGWIYSTLYSNKMCLPHCDKLFPEGRPDFNKTQLEALMRSLIHVYAAQCHLLAEQYGGIKYQTTPENGTKVITDSIQHNYMSIIQQTDQAELADDTLIKKGFRNNVYCKAHQWCLPGTNVQLEGEFDFRKELFSPYEETVNVIWREGLKIPKLPQHLYALLTNLQYLKLEGCDGLKELPDGISKCERLEMISLRNCVIEILPSDLFHIPYLHRFHCHSLKVKTMPTSIPVNCPITHLILSDLLLTSIPKEFGLLTDLELLNLNSNPIETLPMELSSLTKLKTLLLCGVPWIVTGGSKVEMPIDQYQDFLAHNSSLDYYLGREKLMAMFNEADHNKNARLDETEIAALNAIFFWKVPRLGSSCINCSEYGGIPPVIFLLSGLETLHLDFQAITIVPVHMCRLQNLKALSISHNPLLESLPGSLGHLPSLKSLRLVSNPSLRTPPHEVVSRGFQSIKAYLKRLAGGFTECRRTKLMLVGLGGAGKTSLLQALMSDAKKTAGTRGQDITNGIDILPWTVKDTNGVDVTYSTWDFAGQTLYYNTHQFFLSKRAVYLLLWSTRQGFEHAGLEFWLSSIASHAPKTPIFVVGTHCDQVPKADIPIADLKQRYPQIAGFHFVSSLQGTGIIELEKDLLKVTLEQKNMGEKIPQVWLKLEEQILKARKAKSILEWTKIKQFCMEVGIYDEKDIREAIQFLHELGTVQYFDNEFLRDQVVINPQWIVNVMSCVVSVKNSPIQDSKGRFHHKFIKEIWKEYPESLHQWLLRLTEEFDLTFPLPEEATNIVPCLLPQEVPDNLNWPLPDVSNHQKETKLIYQFSYLPAGLFNRAQVRLFQLSDGNLIWKRGSLLKKNKHKALISQTSDSELQVKVQGPRPENVIFLIHEIFESLIQESFHGVIYEFLIPCPDCIIREGTLDPSMFESSLVKRARDHRAPFLQCRKYFHTISMAQLFEVMPSDSDSDFDAHLQNSLTIMQQLNSALSTDVAIIYSSKDKVDDKHPTLLNPERVWRDLEAAGITCWYSDDMDSISVQDLMLALKNCKVVVALVSDNFERDEKSHGLLMYTMDTLAKNFTIVVIGESQEWLNTDLGMRIGKQEEMVMVKTKNRYDESRIQQMVKAVSVKLQQNQQSLQKHPSVFISYCWSNSREAQKLGTICSDKSLGWGDPREVKKELEKKNITCWLDIDQPFAGKGLFKNITEGIRNSKVLVAFVSDEYVSSDNCMMELRFGVLNLQLPTIIVVVGTGKDWKQSEVGILMQRSKAAKVYMQQENPTALDTLVYYIKERMPSHSDQILAQKEIQTKMKNVQEQEKTKVENKKAIDNTSIQEEYELVQRKFMRHIISYVSSMDTVPTPRLIVVDFEKMARSVVKKDGHHDTESILERPGSAGRPRLRPKTASRSSKLMTVVAEDEADQWENETFCLKLLCEDEKGWHICKMSFPVKMNEELKSTLKGCSAYLGRMYAILRQSAVSLNCFDGPIGSQYISWIEQCAVENVNFLDSYIKLRTSLVEDDTAQEFLSQLKRCHLPTGKIYWLCEQHASGPRITRLSTETTSRNEVGRVIYEEDVKLRDNLERSDIYKQRKKGKSPAANIVLPALDVKNKEQVSEYDQAQKTKPAHEPKRQESVRNLATLLTSPSDRSSSSTSVKSTTDSGAATDRSSSSVSKTKGSRACILQ